MNADGVVSGIGKSVQGYNLFAYCFNNSVNTTDKNGHWPQWINRLGNAINSAIITLTTFRTQANAIYNAPTTVAKIRAASIFAVTSGSASIGDVWNNVKNYSFFNTDETKVLNSKVFSSYKGTSVLRHNVSEITSFSISNTIILNRNETKNNGGIDTVKHEWGHTVQQSIMGTPKFVTRVAVPSVISCIANPSSKTYYSLPWERTADFFGGVNRSTGYNEGSDIVSGFYFIMP